MIIIIIPVVLQYGVGVWWGVAVPDLPRDGVSIKHCWLCTLKFTSNQNMSLMSNQSFSLTGVKEAGTNSGEDLSPSKCPTKQQGGPGSHGTTAKRGKRRKWSQEVDRIVMECYYSSNPEVVGYIERIHMIWKEKGAFDVKEQRLLEQIVAKKWFSNLELNKIKENAMGVTEKSDQNDCEGCVGFGEEDNVVCVNMSYIVCWTILV